MAASITSFEVSMSNYRATAVFDLPAGEVVYTAELYQVETDGSLSYIGSLEDDSPGSSGNPRTYVMHNVGATNGTTYRVQICTVQYMVATDDYTTPPYAPTEPAPAAAAADGKASKRAKKQPQVPAQS